MAAALRTRGQTAATAAVTSFVTGGVPHAILLAGPPSVGKTTLALDLAAALLCGAPDAADRPCGGCRGCRLVASGNHPDLHRLAPEGPGGQIRIGDRESPEPGTIRDLIGQLALLPLEGGARVAILERADRLNDAAQQALLKTLEEPPTGTTIVLCADDEDRLLPTTRSRCARVRLGPVAVRDIEALLGEFGLADPPTAARFARIAAGRPGLAVAYALAPEAATIRGEVARMLLDLLGASRAARLAATRDLVARAGAATAAIDVAESGDLPTTPRAKGTRGARPAAGAAAGDAPAAGVDGNVTDPTGTGEDPDAPPARRSAAQRRRDVAWLLEIWRDVARDLAVLEVGDRRALRDPGLLDELEPAVRRLEPGRSSAFLARLARAGDLLDANVSPELLLDVLLLAWPHARAA